LNAASSERLSLLKPFIFQAKSVQLVGKFFKRLRKTVLKTDVNKRAFAAVL
jgi:hypothetical protein